MYLSGKTSQFFAHPDLYGCMFSYKKTGGQDDALKSGCNWMLDNGAYTNRFDFECWVFQMVDMLPHQNNCIGIVVPDVPYDAKATIKKFSRYSRIPKALGYRVAFATQNGLTPELTPWGDFDVLFVGGDDNHKRGPEARQLIDEAKKRGVWVHVGRVSTGDAIGQYWPDADSWDGTTFTMEKVGGRNEGRKMQNLNRTLRNLKKSNVYLQLGMEL